ncbi:hypothetical protein EEB14_51970 [Rhodococcus sp. WS4]|nr:hypothetical protein EEB14_51970 [Rhodococcus sp. WS4]
MYNQFELPPSDELTSYALISSQPLPDTPGGYILRASSDGDEGVELVVDPLGRSIRLRFSILSRLVLDIFPEGATKLRLSESNGELVIAIEFESAEIGGVLNITVGETISVKDSLMLR